jgi:hypothetical protein
MLEQPKAPVPTILDDAHGMAGMNARRVFPLCVAKTEDVSVPTAGEAAPEYATAGISCDDARAALRELKPRLVAHNPIRSGRADEHRTSIEISHETPFDRALGYTFKIEATRATFVRRPTPRCALEPSSRALYFASQSA